MARKAPIKYVPLEERPSFLALVAELVNVPADQFPGAAMQCVDKYHDAVLAGHVEVLDQMEMAYTALVYQLNGGTLQGCAADDSRSARVLARALEARPGQVPCWGQVGEFLLEVDGLRLRVVLTPDMLGNHHGCALHAVDLDRPFISAEGFRAAMLTVTSCLGETVDQAARRLVLELLQAEGGAKPIAANAWARTHPQKAPGWLADALAGVRPDGQLAMFGDAPHDPEAKVPLSNAARQRAFRLRQRELKAEQGARSVLLTRKDFNSLYIGIDAFCTARADLEFLSADSYRESLTRIFKGSHLWSEDFFEKLGHDQGILNREKHRESERKRGWEAYEDSRKYTDQLSVKLAEARAEIQRLQSALQEIAAEVGGVVPVSSRAPDVAGLNKEIDLLSNERNGALAAIKVLTGRLKAAGLSTDYRQLPGE